MICCSLGNRLRLGRLKSAGEINPIEEIILETLLGKLIILWKNICKVSFPFWKAKLVWGREFPGDMLIGTLKGSYMNLLCGDLWIA